MGERGEDYQEALDYLDGLPGRLTRTPVKNPPPTGVEAYLTLHWRGYALEALKAGADPELGAKVGAEMKRATSLRLPVPQEIQKLR